MNQLDMFDKPYTLILGRTDDPKDGYSADTIAAALVSDAWDSVNDFLDVVDAEKHREEIISRLARQTGVIETPRLFVGGDTNVLIGAGIRTLNALLEIVSQSTDGISIGQIKELGLDRIQGITIPRIRRRQRASRSPGHPPDPDTRPRTGPSVRNHAPVPRRRLRPKRRATHSTQPPHTRRRRGRDTFALTKPPRVGAEAEVGGDDDSSGADTDAMTDIRFDDAEDDVEDVDAGGMTEVEDNDFEQEAQRRMMINGGSRHHRRSGNEYSARGGMRKVGTEAIHTPTGTRRRAGGVLQPVRKVVGYKKRERDMKPVYGVAFGGKRRERVDPRFMDMLSAAGPGSQYARQVLKSSSLTTAAQPQNADNAIGDAILTPDLDPDFFAGVTKQLRNPKKGAKKTLKTVNERDLAEGSRPDDTNESLRSVFNARKSGTEKIVQLLREQPQSDGDDDINRGIGRGRGRDRGRRRKGTRVVRERDLMQSASGGGHDPIRAAEHAMSQRSRYESRMNRRVPKEYRDGSGAPKGYNERSLAQVNRDETRRLLKNYKTSRKLFRRGTMGDDTSEIEDDGMYTDYGEDSDEGEDGDKEYGYGRSDAYDNEFVRREHARRKGKGGLHEWMVEGETTDDLSSVRSSDEA